MVIGVFSSMKFCVWNSDFRIQFPFWDGGESCVVIKVLVKHGGFLKKWLYSIHSWIHWRSALFLIFILLHCLQVSLLVFPLFFIINFLAMRLLVEVLECSNLCLHPLVTFIHPSLHFFQYLHALGDLIIFPGHWNWFWIESWFRFRPDPWLNRWSFLRLLSI